MSLSPIEPGYVLATVRDITIHKRYEEELEQHRRRLEELVAKRTAQIEKQAGLLQDANRNLVNEIEQRHQVEQSLRESEKRFRELIEQASDGIFIADLDGRYTDVNGAGCRLLGYSRDEIVGMTILDLIPPEDAERLRQSKTQLLRGAVEISEWNLRRKDGTYVPVEVSAKILSDGRWQGFVRDITERERMERALRESHADLHRAQAVAQTGSWRLDVRRNELLWSDETYRIFGIARGAPMNYAAFLACVHPQDRERVDRGWNAALRGEPYDVEHRIVVDSEVKWVRERADLQYDEAGSLLGGIGTVQDITWLKHAEEALREGEARAASKLKAMIDLHELVTRLLACSDIPSALEEILDAAIALTGAGMGNVQLFDRSLNALVIVTQRGFKQDFLDHFRTVRIDDDSACSRAMASGERVIIEDVQKDPSYESHRRIAESAGYRAVQSTPLMSRRGELLGMLSTHYPAPRRPSDRDLLMLDLYARQAADFIERMRAEEAMRQSEARFRLLLESAGEGIYGLDTEGRCVFVNDTALEMLGFAREELVGRDTHSLIHHSHADGAVYPASECPIYDAFRLTKPVRGVTELLWRKNGSSFPAEYSAQPIRDKGRVTGAVLVFRDVTEAHALRQHLSYQATHDALTGLVNRQEFERRLERVLAEAKHKPGEYALLYLDLDRFKSVNDRCGHTAGDQLLRQLSERLQERMRARDTLARLGGDEFGVLLEHCPPDQALRVATELRDAVRDYQFVWEGTPFTLGVSIGVLSLSAATETVDAALRATDAACYAAKERGRNRVHVAGSDIWN